MAVLSNEELSQIIETVTKAVDARIAEKSGEFATRAGIEAVIEAEISKGIANHMLVNKTGDGKPEESNFIGFEEAFKDIAKSITGNKFVNSFDLSKAFKRDPGQGFTEFLLAKAIASSNLNPTGTIAPAATRFTGFFEKRESDAARLLAMIPTVYDPNAMAVSFNKELAYYPWTGSVASNASQDATSLVLTSVVGLPEDEPIYVGSDLSSLTEILPSARSSNTLTVPALEAAITAGTAVYCKKTSGVAEDVAKPTATYKAVNVTTPMVTIPTIMNVGRTAFRTLASFRTSVLRKIPARWQISLLNQIMFGKGQTSGKETTQLRGIWNESGVSSVTWSDQAAGTTLPDLFRIAKTQCTVAEYSPNFIIISPDDKEALDLTKDGNENYITVTDVTGENISRVWTIPVYECTCMPAGKAIMGDLSACELYYNEQATLETSDVAGDNFSKNLVSVRAEGTVAFALNNPEAFVKITIDSAPA